MRRLAVQSRNDGYSSARDYQELHKKISQRIVTNESPKRIVFFKDVVRQGTNSIYMGFGGFVCAEEPCMLQVNVRVANVDCTREFNVGTNWSRIGLAIPEPYHAEIRVEVSITWSRNCPLHIWGWEADYLNLPPKILEQQIDVALLNSSHVCPETFYLHHENAIDLDVDVENSVSFSLDAGVDIYLKKCAFCQRQLPVNPFVLGSLSFHKHNAKKTFHQNECRACKKWRINDDFNPIRTTDQLHESSVITRERKFLLKEPAILQEIKDRTGAGLKSQIWEKFGRKCFYCERDVPLEEFQLDHTRPLSYLWPIDEHATCLCAEHNNLKKDKFPIDFYNEAQLRRLSNITGLSYIELTAKAVNQVELARIIAEIDTFAMEWDARTFAAIARKVSELMPATNLFNLLRQANTRVYDDLMQELSERPDAII